MLDSFLLTKPRAFRAVGLLALFSGGLAAGLFASAGLSGAGTSAQTTATGIGVGTTGGTTVTTALPALTLEPETTAVTLPFDYERASKSLSIFYSAAAGQTIDEKRAFDLDASDLRGEGRAPLPFDQITWSKVPRGDAGVRFKIAVDPKGAAKGSYTSQLIIVGTGVTADPVQLTATFKERDVWPDYVGAFALVVAAAWLGLGVKWISEHGTKLQRARERLSRLRRSLDAYDRASLPQAYLDGIEEVARLIEQRQGDDALATLEALVGKRDAVLGVARWFTGIESTIRAQEEQIRGRGNFGAKWEQQLLQVTTKARSDAVEAKEDSWPDPAQAAGRRAAITKIDLFGPFLARFEQASDAARETAPLAKALVQYQQGAYQDAADTWASVVDQPAAEREEAVRPAGAPRSAPRLGRRLLNWCLAHASLIAALALGVVIAGASIKILTPTFHGNDWWLLAGAGFTGGLTGATLGDLAKSFQTTSP